MSSGKETPRQKMVGMMYLVLTALLALNVSKEILQGFVMVDESIGKSKVILDENNSRIQKAFEDYVKDGNFEAKPYLLKSIETQKSIRVVDAYIDSMKVIIARKTEVTRYRLVINSFFSIMRNNRLSTLFLKYRGY